MLARKALAGTAGAPKEYVEDVFSTYLYSGTGSTINIVNGIDLSGDGGLVWTKSRSQTGSPHGIVDTARGRSKTLYANTTGSELTSGSTQDITSFNADGFSIGTEFNLNINNASHTYVSWTFRKAKKFFDVVTYTGNASSRTISHNLGSVPGTIIVKCTSEANDWVVYHRSFATPASSYLKLNTTDAVITGNTYIWDNTAPTSSVFSVGASGFTNNSGQTYVAYLFAHDAGGFGDAGSDNVITCGSLTTDGSGEATVTLGYEPQWLLLKPSSTTGNWLMVDTMRGWNVNATGNIQRLRANLSDAEDLGGQLNPTSTGFKTSQSGALAASQTYIYIAIRRGPMKTPTSGTSVYYGLTRNTNGTNTTIDSTLTPTDLMISGDRNGVFGIGSTFFDRLRGPLKLLASPSTGAESSTNATVTGFDVQNGYKIGTDPDGWGINYSTGGPYPLVYWNFKRAPGFFDEVCYTGTGSATTFSHNLGVAPELMIIKSRSSDYDWGVYSASTGATKYLILNSTVAAATSSTPWNNTAPTSSVFTVGTWSSVNASSVTYVAYLFASVSGVSKVGSYTGNGSSVTVTTDFQPRFIMVKRTDSTGNWIVGDSARGLVSGSDPYLLLNSAAAEDTDEDWVDVSSTGFTVNETSAANANVNTGTYIYLAIA